MYEILFPYLLGVMLAWITWQGARRLSPRSESRYFTSIITIVTLGFVGFPIEDGDAVGFAYELGALLVFVVLIILSRKVALVLLPVVWFAHGAWDLVHLLTCVSPSNPQWIHQLCVPFDWILGFYIASRAAPWRESAAEPTEEG